MTSRESHIQQLLEEILDSGKTAEDACHDHPELLPEVAERLERARALETQIDEVFPAGNSRSGRKATKRLATKLPELPGYHIEGVVGNGGIGVVYRARHIKLNRLVAIKMLLAGGYAGPLELERFKREAESVAALCHANIVQVFDAGECDGHPYFVMEFVEGGSLAQRLDGRPRPPTEAVAHITTLARAIHAAHAGGIMHRDLKPANILVTSDGTLKIADFGLARRSDQPDLSGPLTIAGVHLGTPSYMSPEQATGAATEFCPLVDIYALGAILYELLTGRPPFRGESTAETERQVVFDEPVPPTRLSPTVPRDLETICLKCLQKDPKRRYGSAADLADDLDRFSRGDPIFARPIGISERVMKWCRRKPGAAAAIAISVCTIAAAIAGGITLERIESARTTKRVVREESARNAIETAIPILDRLARSRQWAEGEGVLNTAQAWLGDAASADLDSRLATAAERFEVARELDRIRQSIPESAEIGYTFSGASEAYARVFTRVGIGSGVDVATAASRVRESPLRDILLAALDTAAFTEIFQFTQDERARLLAVACAAAPDPWQDRFRDSTKWKDFAHLQKLVQDARSASPSPPVHQLVIVGLLLSSLGNDKMTIEILREAQLREPSDFWVNLELGNVLHRTGKHAESLQFYRTAVALKPTHYVAWTTLGHKLIANGMAEEAIAPLRRATQLQPSYPASWQNLLNSLAQLERWEEAEAAALAAIAANPDNPALASDLDWLHRTRARLSVTRRDWPTAVNSYTRALKGPHRTDSELWFELAAVHLLNGNAEEYRRVCGVMLDRCENAELRQFLAGRVCTLGIIDSSELARATRLSMNELDGSADTAWSLTARGALMCRAGQAREAIPVFENSIRVGPDPVHAIINWVWLAKAHLSLGEKEDAQRWLDKAGSWLDMSELPDKSLHLHNWLEALVMRREVQAELGR